MNQKRHKPYFYSLCLAIVFVFIATNLEKFWIRSAIFNFNFCLGDSLSLECMDILLGNRKV